MDFFNVNLCSTTQNIIPSSHNINTLPNDGIANIPALISPLLQLNSNYIFPNSMSMNQPSPAIPNTTTLSFQYPPGVLPIGNRHSFSSMTQQIPSTHNGTSTFRLDPKDIEILQLKTKIRSLESEIGRRDLIIKMLEKEIKHRDEAKRDDEVTKRDIVIKILEKEISQTKKEINIKDEEINKKNQEITKKDEEIEDQLEIYDDICDKMGYEWQWEYEKGKNKWDIYPYRISKIIERMEIDDIYEYKDENDDYFSVKKLDEDKAIQENDESGHKQYVRRTEKFSVLEETEAKYQEKQQVIDDQKEQIKNLGDKIEDINKKVGYSVIWEWQENDTKWISYNKAICEIIEKMEAKDDYEYEHKENKQKYIITKIAMDKAEQENKRSQYKRDVRRTERFIKLNTLLGSTAGVEYPQYWDMASQTIDDYARPKLVSLSGALLSEVTKRFYQTVSKNEYEIVKVETVQNQMLYDKYCGERQSMIKMMGENRLNERYLHHGTKKQDAMDYIITEGFRKEFNCKSMYGMGTYFARDARYSVGYSSSNNGVYKMFQCKVICGECHGGSSSYSLKSWPKKSNGLLYDSLVDGMSNPSIFVIHENVRAYPMYIIHFKKKQRAGYWY